MRKITQVWHGVLLCVLFVFTCVIYAFCQQKDADPHATGLIRPAPEERAQEIKSVLKLKKVHLNKLGFERVNAHRAQKGQSLLDARDQVALTQEIESAVGGEYVGAPQASTSPSTSAIPSTLPNYIDNSGLKYFPPIRSQGSLNSCASFSATYYTMTHMYALARDLDAKNGGDAFRFSPKWNYNMLNGGANVGTWHYDCYKIGIKHGVATWAEFPYDANYTAWCLNPTVWQDAISRRFAQYGVVSGVNSDTGLNQVKQLLVNGYILNYATYINSWQYKAIGNDPATASDDAFAGKSCAYMANGTNGGHAMTIVGYNDDVWVDINGDGQVAPNEKGALRIANSWGTGWQEGGFSWIAYQALRTPNPAATSEGIFWYNEATWVTARLSYAPQLIAQCTLNHLKRNQLRMSFGISTTGQVAPTAFWYPEVLNNRGGAYAFDGSTVARDATFSFDLTDILPTDGSLKRYYAGMSDSATGDMALLKTNRLIDLNNAGAVNATDVPKTADAAQVYSFIDYQYGSDVALPVAVMSAAPALGYAPLTVSFDGTGSYASGGSISTYAWNFGDGAFGSGPTASHTYNNYGVFTASLMVTDSRGALSNPAATMPITVVDNNQPPVALVTAIPISGFAPLPVSFSATGSFDPDGSIATCSWDFGDGAGAAGPSVGHTYTASGSFTATLTVADNKGATGTATAGITVSPDPDLIAAPTGLSAATARGTVTLFWKDNASNEQGFYVERGLKPKGGSVIYSRIGSVGANVVSYSDTVASGTYYYRVQAYSLTTGKVSGYSNALQVRVAKR